jgi:hypothetical protein
MCLYYFCDVVRSQGKSPCGSSLDGRVYGLHVDAASNAYSGWFVLYLLRNSEQVSREARKGSLVRRLSI